MNRNKLIIHDLSDLSSEELAGYEYLDFNGDNDIKDYEMQAIISCDISEIWYWYGWADYCGSGQLLGKHCSKNLYTLYDMSHCSCYGRMCHISSEHADFSTLDELQKRCTDDLSEETRALFYQARRKYGVK